MFGKQRQDIWDLLTSAILVQLRTWKKINDNSHMGLEDSGLDFMTLGSSKSDFR
jgi:hypothetical protein